MQLKEGKDKFLLVSCFVPSIIKLMPINAFKPCFPLLFHRSFSVSLMNIEQLIPLISKKFFLAKILIFWKNSINYRLLFFRNSVYLYRAKRWFSTFSLCSTQLWNSVFLNCYANTNEIRIKLLIIIFLF